MSLRELVSAALGVRIQEGGWAASLNSLDRMGAFQARQMKEVLIVLCQKVEELEKTPAVVETIVTTYPQIPVTIVEIPKTNGKIKSTSAV